jgi:hypothetical protein
MNKMHGALISHCAFFSRPRIQVAAGWLYEDHCLRRSPVKSRAPARGIGAELSDSALIPALAT